MSLTNALNNAVSGLNVSQASLALVSQNIANANNENYSRKVAIQEAVIAGGARAGVRIAEIKRYVDQYLRREILSTSADWGNTMPKCRSSTACRILSVSPVQTPR